MNFSKEELVFIRAAADAVLRHHGMAVAEIATAIDKKCIAALERLGEDPLGKQQQKAPPQEN